MSDEEEYEYVYEEEEEDTKPPKKSKRVAAPRRKKVKEKTAEAVAPMGSVQGIVEQTKADLSHYDITGKLIHIRVGDALMQSENPEQLEEEIEKVEEQINQLVEDNDIDCLVMVTHYAVDIHIVQ